MLLGHFQFGRPASFRDSLKAIEADIEHANLLAASVWKTRGGVCLHMKLVYNDWAPIYSFLLEWINRSCACLLPGYLNLFHVVVYKVYLDSKPKFPARGRKATLDQFYAVILPSLERLRDGSPELGGLPYKVHSLETTSKMKPVESSENKDADEREKECGICLEISAKMVLPNCCHELCIKCYNDWNMRSQSCPFCRDSLDGVSSGDLWVLTCNHDVVDQETLREDDILRLFHYINCLPGDIPDVPLLGS